MGDRERGKTADKRVYRERNHDGAVHRYGYVDVSGKGGQWLEEDIVAKWQDSIYLFGKH